MIWQVCVAGYEACTYPFEGLNLKLAKSVASRVVKMWTLADIFLGFLAYYYIVSIHMV